jgi:hypothetical protein
MSFDLLRRSRRNLLASLALMDIKFQRLLDAMALMNSVLEYSIVCRARRPTQAKVYKLRSG